MNETNGTKAKQVFALNDRTNLRALRVGIDEGLAAFAKEHGLVIKAGNISYERDGTKATVKLTVEAPNESGVFVPQEEKDFEKYAFAYGLKAEQLHSIIDVHGEKYEVVGLRSKARKNPVSVKRVRDGKRFAVATRYLEGGAK
jgi:hypothetical protein